MEKETKEMGSERARERLRLAGYKVCAPSPPCSPPLHACLPPATLMPRACGRPALQSPCCTLYPSVCVCEGERKREGEAEKEGWQVVVCLVALL